MVAPPAATQLVHPHGREFEDQCRGSIATIPASRRDDPSEPPPPGDVRPRRHFSPADVEREPIAPTFPLARRHMCGQMIDRLAGPGPEPKVQNGHDEQGQQCRRDEAAENNHGHRVLDLVTGNAAGGNQR